jgi:hypothetical protein
LIEPWPPQNVLEEFQELFVLIQETLLMRHCEREKGSMKAVLRLLGS